MSIKMEEVTISDELADRLARAQYNTYCNEMNKKYPGITMNEYSSVDPFQKGAMRVAAKEMIRSYLRALRIEKWRREKEAYISATTKPEFNPSEANVIDKGYFHTLIRMRAVALANESKAPDTSNASFERDRFGNIKITGATLKGNIVPQEPLKAKEEFPVCGSCSYFNDLAGNCQLYPNKVAKHKGQWCGQHKLKETKEVNK